MIAHINDTEVILERDGAGFHIYCPSLRAEGASTWGETKEEALNHIQEVLDLIYREREEG